MQVQARYQAKHNVMENITLVRHCTQCCNITIRSVLQELWDKAYRYRHGCIEDTLAATDEKFVTSVKTLAFIACKAIHDRAQKQNKGLLLTSFYEINDTRGFSHLSRGRKKNIKWPDARWVQPTTVCLVAIMWNCPWNWLQNSPY